nr:MAG TPA: hypothetical protein [Caudoviricetes sp.]
MFLFPYFCNIPTQITLIKIKSDIIYFKNPIIVLSVQVSEIRTNSDDDSFFR